MIVLSLWLLSAAQLAPAPVAEDSQSCTDVYDQTIACPGVDKTPLDQEGEPLTTAAAPQEAIDVADPIDLNSIGWGFIVGSAITASLAASLQLTSLAYRLRVWELASANRLSVDTYRDLADAQYYMGIAATSLWFASALIAGSGVSFWVFDPRDGSFRDPFATE